MSVSNKYQLDDTASESTQYRELARRIWPYLKRHKFLFFFIVTLVFLHTGISRLLPGVIGWTIDHIIVPKDYTFLATVTLVYLGLEVLRFFAVFVEGYLFQVLGQTLIHEMRIDLYRHIHRLPIGYFDRTPVGRLVTRVTNDFGSLADLFTSGLVSVFTDSLSLVAITIAMFLIDMKLALVVMAVTPFMIWLSVVISRKFRKIVRAIKKQIAMINAFVSENINGMKIVQLYGQEDTQKSRFRNLNEDYRILQMRNIHYFALLNPLLFLFNAITVTAALYYGGYMSQQSGLKIGALVAFLTHVRDFLPPLRNIVEKYQTFQSSLASAERIFTIMDVKEESFEGDLLSKTKLAGHIEFRNVTFAYSDDTKPVLKNVNFEILPGQSVALVGSTGSGKSTVISLIQRFYELDLAQVGAGQILLDGINIRTLNKTDLRKRIGVVQQDFFTFKGSLGSNISLKNQNFTDNQILSAAIKANCAELLKRNGGLDGLVQERGTNLSAGEKQLLNFARILVFNPDILILDEATAHIDSVSEQLIQEATREATRGRTSIVIAHRLSTIVDCDNIIVLSHGEVIEQGKHSELLEKQGAYHDFYYTQLSPKPIEII